MSMNKIGWITTFIEHLKRGVSRSNQHQHNDVDLKWIQAFLFYSFPNYQADPATRKSSFLNHIQALPGSRLWTAPSALHHPIPPPLGQRSSVVNPSFCLLPLVFVLEKEGAFGAISAEPAARSVPPH